MIRINLASSQVTLRACVQMRLSAQLSILPLAEACFVDFRKAFDIVNCWWLFQKLLHDGVNKFVVRLLAYWYCNQEARIWWQNSVSGSFRFSNSTRQGGVLSPYLFSRYIRELLCELAEANAGCNIGGMYVNVLAYADDIVLCAPSWRAL